MQGEVAVFAGGCFWCLQHDFDQAKGVISTTVGYTGGHVVAPTYEEVCGGNTGHVEAIQVVYNPQMISYEQLLHIFWQGIEPTRNDGQFCDIGTQYRPVIFYHNAEQKLLAEKSKQELSQVGKPILVDILPGKAFYPAEEYHQEYYKKNPIRYKTYRVGSGRDQH